MTKTTTSVIILILILGAAFLLNFQSAQAATGGAVTIRTFSVPCSSGIGVGIAFDGTHLWYSCYNSPTDLYRADPTTGVVDQSYSIKGGLGALAYDSVNNVIYAGPAKQNPSCDILAIQLDASKSVTGTTTKFSSTLVCTVLDDGLAYDGTDNTFYYSPDASTIITHFDALGNVLKSFTWTGTGCYNSGLAIGGSLLFQGSNGCNHIWVVNKTTLAPAYDFATGAGGVRDEGLACDTVTFAGLGKQVMWSMEAYEPRRAAAFEIAPGTCGIGGQDPPTNIATPPTVTATAISSTQIDLGIIQGANTGSPVTGYQIFEDSGSGFTSIIADTGSTSSPVPITGLLPEHSYSFKVQSINGAGHSADSNFATATTLVAPPTDDHNDEKDNKIATATTPVAPPTDDHNDEKDKNKNDHNDEKDKNKNNHNDEKDKNKNNHNDEKDKNKNNHDDEKDKNKNK